jgi:hypothetical protein
MNLLPSDVAALVYATLSVPDLLHLGATCKPVWRAVDAALGLRSDIRIPISSARAELVKSKWDELTSLEIFLEPRTLIQPTLRIEPLPRRFGALRRLHLHHINLPVAATRFWTDIFDLVPLLQVLVVDIVTYPATICLTNAHIECIVDIGAPRLVELQVHERGSMLLSPMGSYVHRVESDTLQTLHLTGMHVPNTCIDAPLTSVVIEETTSSPPRGVACLGPRCHETLTHLEIIVHHTYDIAKLRAFKALTRLRVTVHGSNESAIILLSELSNKLAGTSVEEIDLHIKGSDELYTTWIPPPVTFRGVFKGLTHLTTLRVKFQSTPVWITNFVCGLDAPALSNVYLESGNFGTGSDGWSTRRHGLNTGSVNASRLRAYLALHPTLRISTKNISHF